MKAHVVAAGPKQIVKLYILLPFRAAIGPLDELIFGESVSPVVSESDERRPVFAKPGVTVERVKMDAYVLGRFQESEAEVARLVDHGREHVERAVLGLDAPTGEAEGTGLGSGEPAGL